MFNYQKQHAFTLIELVLTMTIGILIMAISYQGYKVLSNDSKVKQTADSVEMIFSDAEMMTSSLNDYSISNSDGSLHDINILDIINNRGTGDLPMGMIVDGAQVVNRFGGTIQLSNESSVGSAKDLLRVEVSNVPKGQCMHLLAVMAPKVYDMYVGSSLVPVGPPAIPAAMGRNEIRGNSVAAVCDTSNLSTISFRRLKDINYSAMRRGPYADLTPAEQAVLIPAYNRVENAMDAREAAQLAIP